MKKLLIVLFGALAFQTSVWGDLWPPSPFNEGWEDRAATNTPWSTEFEDDPVCWNPQIWHGTENPWVVGVGDHVAYHDLADCFRACAENDTCYRDNWKNEDAASATCKLGRRPLWLGARMWQVTIPLSALVTPSTQYSFYVMAWCL